MASSAAPSVKSAPSARSGLKRGRLDAASSVACAPSISKSAGTRQGRLGGALAPSARSPAKDLDRALESLRGLQTPGKAMKAPASSPSTPMKAKKPAKPMKAASSAPRCYYRGVCRKNMDEFKVEQASASPPPEAS